MKREKILFEKIPKLSEEIIELIKQHGKLNLFELEKITKKNKSTLKKHLQSLVKKNHLKQNGKGKATFYSIF